MTELNETWDMGRLIDLGGDLYNGMWKINDPLFPPFELKELDMVEFCERVKQNPPSFTQTVSMCVQCGTYLETGAHMFPEMETMADVGLDRLFLDAIVLHVDVGPGEHVTAEMLQESLDKTGEEIKPGGAILVAVGYSIFDQEISESSHFSYSAFEWMLKFEPAIIGSDMASWYDGKEEPGFFPMFLKSGSLLLAPMINLKEVDVPKIKLIVMPLKMRGACASPCRVIGILPAKK